VILNTNSVPSLTRNIGHMQYKCKSITPHCQLDAALADG